MKQIIGTVISTKTANTAIVQVTQRWKHPVYGKIVNKKKNFACHVEKLKVAEGESVVIEECRPMSKTKHFRVIKKVE